MIILSLLFMRHLYMECILAPFCFHVVPYVCCTDSQVEIDDHYLLLILEDSIVNILTALFSVLFVVPYWLFRFLLCRSDIVTLGWEYLILFF